jgi:transposase
MTPSVPGIGCMRKRASKAWRASATRAACRLSEAQQDKLKAWVGETLPRTTREVGAWIETECGITYESRSGLIALLHRLDMEHRKPQVLSSKLDPDKQAAFINQYDNLLNHMGDDEAVLFADAVWRFGLLGWRQRNAEVHPTHAVRPVGCWAPKDTPVAIEQTSGRQRLNIHGAIDLETGQDPDDRGGDSECDQHDHADEGDRDDVSGQAADPSVSGQCPVTTTPSWCRLGWRDRGAGSSSTSFQPIAHIWIRSSGFGA